MQSTNRVLMVKPVAFTQNPLTLEDNTFQAVLNNSENLQERALQEFNNFTKQLQDIGIEVIIAEDTPTPHTPDSIFPNNWFSTHSSGELEKQEGTIILYPLYATNRRDERNKDVLNVIENKVGGYKNVIDLTYLEKENKFLEGTGSMILDRVNKIAYCCASKRTDLEALQIWAEKTDYDYCIFDAVDDRDVPIYHTNVIMSLGEQFAIICLDTIEDISQRVELIELLEETDKEIIEITLEQVGSFLGNTISLKNNRGEFVLVLSQTAYNSLSEEQLSTLSKYHKHFVTPDIETIESAGGGGVRCMIAELF